jgi:predicted dehydrogenase
MKNKRKRPVSVVLVGIGGMGQQYLQILRKELSPHEVEIRGVVDPSVELKRSLRVLKNQDIAVYSSLNEFFENNKKTDLVVISSPIHCHVPQTCEALEQGSYVLCEKPIGATIQEAERLIQEKNKYQRWVMIGYQWSYSKAVQDLKNDILSGEFGRPLRLKTLCCWHRDEAYYRRNDWAGKIRENNTWILDSPANNAMAHFLHNLFYVLGEKTDRSAKPAQVTAELYRIYPIDNYDTIACQVYTRDGVEMLYYASHAAFPDLGPMFCFEFERATVTFGENSDQVVARDQKGYEKRYGSPESEHPFKKLFEALDAVRKPKPVLCGPEAALPQTLCVDGIQESVEEIASFPPQVIQQGRQKEKRWVKNLASQLFLCYQKGILPHKAKLPWAHAGETISVEDYRYFPGGMPPAERT